MRYLLLVCLLAGCSAGAPTLSQRDNVRTFVYSAARDVGATPDMATCMAGTVDTMSDTAIAKVAPLVGQVPIGSIPELWLAVTKCRTN